MRGRALGYGFLATEQLCGKISRSEKLSNRLIYATAIYSCKISIEFLPPGGNCKSTFSRWIERRMEGWS